MRYSNGDVYSGGWKNDTKGGYGVYYFTQNGGSLSGQWCLGKLTEGTWKLPNGNIFTGNLSQMIGKWTSVDGVTVKGHCVQGHQWSFNISL